MSIFDKFVRQVVQGATNIVQDAADQMSDIIQPSQPFQPEQQDVPQELPYYYNNIPAPSSGNNLAPQPNAQTNPVSVVVDESQPSEIDRLIEQQRQDQINQRSLDGQLAPLFQKMTEFAQNYNGSDQQLADSRAALEREQQEQIERGRQTAENQLYSNYAAMGINPYDDPMYQQNVQAVQDMDEVPWIQRQMDLRFRDADTGNVRNPLDWNFLGFTAQQKTPGYAKDIYDYYFAQEDEARKNAQPVMNAVDEENTGGNIIKRGNVVGMEDVDDGAPEGREALYMTGEQYIKYRDQYGLPGRDVKDINPKELYNKQHEQDEYGFIPYITSDESLDKFHNDASAQFVNDKFNDLANARRYMTDYDINYDGNKYSGKDFMKNLSNWSARVENQWQDPYRMTRDRSQTNEYSIPYAAQITFSDGSTEKVYGEPYGYTDEDGTLVWLMPDGVAYRFADEEDFKNSVSYVPAEDTDFVYAWQNIDPLELDDGQRIRADKVNYLMQQNGETGQKNLEQYTDYGTWGKPYISNPIEEGNWLPWFVDMALGSAPLFYGPTGGMQAAGNAMANNTGFDAGYDDYMNRTYSMLSENPTEEQRNTAVLGSAMLPLTEHIWGNLGNAAFKGPLMKLATKGGKEAGDITPMLRWGIDAAQEGLEEVPGNLVEEFQRNGITDFYADDLLDEYGNPVIDAQGRTMKAPTDFVGRAHNFIEDIPLALLGGTTLGGTLGAANIPGYRNEYNTRAAERALYGDNLVKPSFDSSVAVDIPQEERDRYNYR